MINSYLRGFPIPFDSFNDGFNEADKIQFFIDNLFNRKFLESYEDINESEGKAEYEVKLTEVAIGLHNFITEPGEFIHPR